MRQVGSTWSVHTATYSDNSENPVYVCICQGAPYDANGLVSDYSSVSSTCVVKCMPRLTAATCSGHDCSNCLSTFAAGVHACHQHAVSRKAAIVCIYFRPLCISCCNSVQVYMQLARIELSLRSVADCPHRFPCISGNG